MHLRSTPARRARERQAELERATAAAKTAAALMATGPVEASGSRSSEALPPQGDSSVQESVVPQGSQTVVPEDAVTVSVPPSREQSEIPSDNEGDDTSSERGSNVYESSDQFLNFYRTEQSDAPNAGAKRMLSSSYVHYLVFLGSLQKSPRLPARPLRFS